MYEYSPVVVFAYNRADKLQILLNSLEHNENTEYMDLFIFVDIPNVEDTKNIEYNKEVQHFVYEYKNGNPKFKSVQIVIAKEHKGLANSIISGVTKIINEYGAVIVLEDDLIVSSDFLDYMQRGLSFYKNDNRIWSIAGYSKYMPYLKTYKYDVFLALRAESWGWGTWKDRWDKVDWEVKTYKKFAKNPIQKFLFNLGGNELSIMLRNQMKTENYNSWAIRWCYQQFLERKYTIFPKESRVVHCGDDNKSTHNAPTTAKLKDKYDKSNFENISVDYRILNGYRKVNSISIYRKIYRKIKKIFD